MIVATLVRGCFTTYFHSISFPNKLVRFSKVTRVTASVGKRKLSRLAIHERRFYAANRAFGRFGIRTFNPVTMNKPHSHGHLEINFTQDFEIDYDLNGSKVTVEANRGVAFWAGIPHQLTTIRPLTPSPGKQCNIYLPLDSFLMMRHIKPLQVALLSGGLVVLPETLFRNEDAMRWYDDYRTGDFERSELVKMELNALFRRVATEGPKYLRTPEFQINKDRELSSRNIHHVILMIQHIVENSEKPLRNSEITSVTGLHENYAIGLFKRVMHIPIKQFVIRMRLLHARAMLVESTMSIQSIAVRSGFSSMSQFYTHFERYYGMTPSAIRKEYLQANAY